MPKLTKRAVEATEIKSSEYFLWDDELPGFGLRVLASGRKGYVVQYRAGRRSRRISLGPSSVLTCEQARNRAITLIAAAKNGEDPAAKRDADRAAITVADLAERFDREHVALRLKQSTAKGYRRMVERVILPALGRHRVNEVTRADIAKLHHDMRHIPYDANRCIEIISKMFNLAEMWGLRPDGSNPRKHLKKYPEEKRERFLSAAELRRVGEVLREMEDESVELASAIAAVRLLILTGCRLSEIMRLKWEYVDFPRRALHLPDSKTGAKTVHLGQPAVDVLKSIARVEGNPWVVTGTLPGAPLCDLQPFWQRVDCLIFNFVATNTIEGRVLQRLLHKLQEIRDALDDDAVFNVVGEVLPAAHIERVLRDYYAGRLGDVDLEDRLLRDVDENHFRAICQTALEGLASKRLNLDMLIERRAKAQERRVVPETIARFIKESAEIASFPLQPVISLAHAFDPGRTPPALRKYERDADWKLPPLVTRYPRLSTDRDVAESNNLEWVMPGHPLFEALRRHGLEAGHAAFAAGARFYSLEHAQPARLDFYRARIVDGLGHIIHERLFVVELSPDGTANLRELDVLGNLTATDAATALPSIASLPEATAWLNEHALMPFLDEVRAISRAAGLACAVREHVGDLAGLAGRDLRKFIKTQESVAMPEGDALKTVCGCPPGSDIGAPAHPLELRGDLTHKATAERTKLATARHTYRPQDGTTIGEGFACRSKYRSEQRDQAGDQLNLDRTRPPKARQTPDDGSLLQGHPRAPA